jgi:EpsD family peptidyl-prolyl cis-trans isomerase
VIKTSNTFKLAVIVAALSALGGCGKDDGPKAATQVAAKVNGTEISVHQINGVLARATGLTPENAPRVKREILDKLIDQQIAVQQAMESKLDRDPKVMQAIEAAKRELLARAYLEKLAAALPKPTPEEVKKFHVEHPELFAGRRIYNLQELSVAPDPALTGEIKQWMNQGATLAEIAGKLKSRDIKFAANSGIRAAEQLPIEAAPRFQALKEGQTIMMEGQQGTTVAHVLGIKTQPIEEPAALNRIAQFIGNQRSAEAIVKELKALRDKASIERMGEFAEAAGTPAAPTAAPAPAAAAPVAETPTTAGPIDDKAIAKGVAGLK